MFHLITGGSGSGKSEYAEQMICKYWEREGRGKLFYIATMFPYGEETQAKIQRHKEMRTGKSFETVECYTNLLETAHRIAADDPDASVLLECISNLAANEIYMAEGAGKDAVKAILQGVACLCGGCSNLVVVTNEVCSEGWGNGMEMNHYCKVVGDINICMEQAADLVTEVVCGIPVEVKV